MDDLRPFLQQICSPKEIEVIFGFAKQALHTALKEGQKFPKRVENYRLPQESLPLEKVFSTILDPFATQSLGGFDIDSAHCSQEQVIQKLRDAYTSFDGLFFGVEAPHRPYFGLHSIKKNECIVYENKGILHEKQLCSWKEDTKNSASVYLYQRKNQRIYIGHMRSGTLDPKISSHNREGLLGIVAGRIAPRTDMFFHLVHDIFFGDVNFDVTDPQNIQALVAFSTEFPVQFVLSQARVQKMRIANRPFANNQVHKGGKMQISESMLAVFPRTHVLEAIDSLGFFVIRDGLIWNYSQGETPSLTKGALPFRMMHAFSEEILLDHAPIRLRANGCGYQFHNFMEFDGSRGFGATSYDPLRLRVAEEDFVRRLLYFLRTEPS